MGPLEYIYYLGYSLKRSHSLKAQKRLPARVFSVGNLTVGGTGKTPAVIAIAEEAQRRGHLPCILTLGYKGTTVGPCFVSKGDGPLLSLEQAGDEPVLMAERLKGVPVVKGKDRYEAGMFALRHLESEIAHLKSKIVFILDDGFQHWRLFRDTDILLIDSTNPFGNRRLLPLGRLREPLSGMKRADIIVITKRLQKNAGGNGHAGPAPIDNLINEIRDNNPDAPIYTAEHLPVGLRTLSGIDLPVSVLSGKRVFGFCGVGSPASFRDTLQSVGAQLVKDIVPFRDHVAYTEKDVRKIDDDAKRQNADWIVTTEKDIIKLKRFSVPENLAAILVSLHIEFSVDAGFYENVFSTSQ